MAKKDLPRLKQHSFQVHGAIKSEKKVENCVHAFDLFILFIVDFCGCTKMRMNDKWETHR